MTPCPKHPTAAAVITCARCGTFACEACRSPTDATLCVDCGQRYAVVGLAPGDIVREAFEFLKRHSQGAIGYAAAQAVFGLVTLPLTQKLGRQAEPGEDPFALLMQTIPAALGLIVLSVLFSAAAYVVFIRYVGDGLEGRQRPFGELVQESLGRLPAMIGMNILLGIAVGLGTLLCIIPGIILGIALTLAPAVLMLEPAGAVDSLSISWERTKGHRVQLALTLLLTGLILVGLGIAGGIVGAILGLLGTVGLILSTLVTQAASGLGYALTLTVVIFCYLRLSGRYSPLSAER